MTHGFGRNTVSAARVPRIACFSAIQERGTGAGPTLGSRRTSRCSRHASAQGAIELSPSARRRSLDVPHQSWRDQLRSSSKFPRPGFGTSPTRVDLYPLPTTAVAVPGRHRSKEVWRLLIRTQPAEWRRAGGPESLNIGSRHRFSGTVKFTGTHHAPAISPAEPSLQRLTAARRRVHDFHR